MIYILAVIGITLVIVTVAISMRPSTFHVERSGVMSAPPAVVFDQINNLHHWNNWSPWAKLDPNARITYEGPEAGNGASFSWAGNKEVGEGRMTVIESRPGELVRFKLEFFKPFAATSTATFTLKPEGEGKTDVTWSMDGTNNFIAKAAGLFMNCDDMLGTSFSKGLASLDKESQAAVAGKL